MNIVDYIKEQGLVASGPFVRREATLPWRVVMRIIHDELAIHTQLLTDWNGKFELDSLKGRGVAYESGSYYMCPEDPRQVQNALACFRQRCDRYWREVAGVRMECEGVIRIVDDEYH